MNSMWALNSAGFQLAIDSQPEHVPCIISMNFTGGFLSASVARLLQRGDVELAHLQHRRHDALRPRGIGVARELDHLARHDLPRDAELVLQPAAVAGLAAVDGELRPQRVD